MRGLGDAPHNNSTMRMYSLKSLLFLALAAGLLTGCGGAGTNTADNSNKSEMKSNTPARTGEAFLAENAKKTGVVTTASGLQYLVSKSGTGESPRLTDTVKVHYEGRLINGTVFDSSIQRGQPISFPVNRVIPGWTEALQLMKVGDKWQLFIPARLAYGDMSPTPDIPPNSVLIFDVELLGVEK
jgi:FKBP-type peptidyl-prolyl cis-trans isomerase FklB